MGTEEYRLAQLVDGLGLQDSGRQAPGAVADRVARQLRDRLTRGFELIVKPVNTHRNFKWREQSLCLAQQAFWPSN